MSDTYSAGDRSSDPGTRYGTCLREQIDCNDCADTGVLGDPATSLDYCDCPTGRYIQRVERGDA
jgi:hypothetical protein